MLLQRWEESRWSPHPASFGEIGHTQGEMTKEQGQWGVGWTLTGTGQRGRRGEAEKVRETVVTATPTPELLGKQQVCP